MAGFTLHRPAEEDWQLVRDLRIRAIEDFPLAFLESLDAVRALDDEGWRARVRRNLQPQNVQFVAIDDAGRWIGSMTCFVTDGPPPYLGRPAGGPPRANLVGVFVDPDWRGDGGVTTALLDAIGRWVRDDRGLAEVYLHVSQANPRAQRAYEKRGWVPTGVIEQIPDDPANLEVEMVWRF
jgi:GNAT superfamily N-acetyltransferase